MFDQGIAYVELLRRTNDLRTFLALCGGPALVMVSGPERLDDGTQAFSTHHSSAFGDYIERHRSALVASPSHGLVHFVRKRPGAVFAEQIGLGRTRTVDISVPSARISKYHAYFSVNDGRWTVADAGSKNGTHIQGRRLLEREPTTVEDGEAVSFGTVTFVFHTAKGLFERLRDGPGEDVLA